MRSPTSLVRLAPPRIGEGRVSHQAASPLRFAVSLLMLLQRCFAASCRSALFFAVPGLWPLDSAIPRVQRARKDCARWPHGRRGQRLRPSWPQYSPPCGRPLRNPQHPSPKGHPWPPLLDGKTQYLYKPSRYLCSPRKFGSKLVRRRSARRGVSARPALHGAAGSVQAPP